MEKLYVIRYGEIALKGANRHIFVKRLEQNIKYALEGIKHVRVLKEHGRIFVYHLECDAFEVAEALKKVYGIVSFSPAETSELLIDEIAKLAIDQMASLVKQHGDLTFKVETRRPNKKFPKKSPQVSSEVGSMILSAVKGVKVDVRQPDYICFIEIRDKAYVYTDIIKGQGGMPYGSTGRGLLLLSGGIDSPVAGYLMAKRGLQLEVVHYHSYPFTSERAQQKVEDLARKLAAYTGPITMHSVNLLEIQQAIGKYCPESEMTILSRRAMMKIATLIAEERGLGALVTGESLGQVASQTLEGINVTTDATHLPVFRPLIAMDKLDIVNVAIAIDTYEISIRPFEDCCTVFLPKRVAIKPNVFKIRDSESLIPIEELVVKAVSNRKIERITVEESLDL